MDALVRYNAARSALAEAVRIDEAKDIRDRAVAIEAYARQAKDYELEANAVELRERATRRLGELIAAAKEQGEISRGQPPKKNCAETEQFSARVRLEDLGIDRKLSSHAQRLASVPADQFEAGLARMRTGAMDGKSPSDVMRASQRDQRREAARHIATALSDATALSAEGRKFPVVYADPAWRRKAGFGDRAYENQYPTQTWHEIMAMPVANRLLPDAWVFLWIPRAHLLALVEVEIDVDTPLGRTTAKVKMPLAWAVARAWGCEQYSTCLVWTKTDEEFPDDHGTGLIFYDQDELLLLFKRGRGLPMPDTSEKFGSNYRARGGRHSEKPAFFRDMIITMTGGAPVLELYAREDADHVLPPNFYTWGNQSHNTADRADHVGHNPLTGEVFAPSSFIAAQGGQQ